MKEHSLLTRCVRAGEIVDDNVGGVTTPIHTASSYLYSDVRGVCYPRYTNIPTQRAVCDKIAALESAEAGLVFGSGMGAITSIFLALLSSGDHAVVHKDLYGGTHKLVTEELPRLGVGVTFVDGYEPGDFERAMQPNTKMIYFESPTNPLLRIVDIASVAEIARKHDAVSVIDNTFASPINQTPHALGVDLVAHSGTKYLNGHSDLNCGAVTGSKEMIDRVDDMNHTTGATLNVYDAFLLERGMKTLGVRMRQHNENALALAEFLDSHPKVKTVHYPGLSSHPGHRIAAKQMRGFGGMLSFEPDCGVSEARKLTDSLKLFLHAVSLGGVESLVCFPSLTSHDMMPRDQRLALGITDTLIRVSTGIEDTKDLIADMEQALERI